MTLSGNKKWFVFLLGIVTVFVFITNASIEAQSSRPSRFGIENVPHLPNAENEETSSTQSVQSVNILPWSKVTFQSFRDDNWNIYVGNDNGSGQVRLTNHNAAEVQPHLNRGNTQIVYARKNGDYDIYKMNVDGSNQVALTADGTDDGNPVWSPDGTKIAFESYRDGQAEVYVMNADGSGQTRLTAHPDFDGMPTWSPDGTKIAFVSRRTGGYRIYVMNVNGSNQVQISTQPYSLRPQWSPDGTQIAFDADGDRDGWQDIWVVNVDGTNQRELFNPHGTRDAWTGSWSPDGRYIAYTNILFVQYQGSWYWTNAYADAWDTLINDNRRISNNGRDWIPRWQASDDQPPVSNVLKLPAFSSLSYSSTSHAAIGWDGYDIGESGLGGFNIQYRQGENGTWQNWIDDTTENTGEYPALAGSTVQFRSRAHDNAYNWENWSVGADTQTTFYDWTFSGTVTDNRGVPLGNKEIAVSPNTIFSVKTDELGAYQGYTLSSGEHVLSISSQQYDQFENTIIRNWESVDQTYYLAPADNLFQNSSFEENDGQLTGWNVNGNLAIEANDEAHVSGGHAAVMGSICTDPNCFTSAQPFSLEGNPAEGWYLRGQVFTAGKSGTFHVLFVEGSYQNYEVYHRVRSVDGSWSEPILVYRGPHVQSGIRMYLKMDSHGTLHAVWIDPEGLKYLRKQVNEQWSTVKNLATNLDYGTNAYVADFEVDFSDGLHILIRQIDGLLHLERTPDGQWQDFTEVWWEYVNTPLLAIGPDNALHFAWQKTYSDDPAGDHLLFYRVRTPDGNWLPREVLYDRDDFFATYVTELEVDKEGRVHYLWTSRDLYHSVKNSDGIWLDPVKLGRGFGGLKIEQDDEGKLISMHYDSTDDAIKSRYYTYESGWSELADIEPGEAYRNLIFFEIDRKNFFHLTTYANDSFQYQRTKQSGFQGSSGIFQQVNIPVDMNAPTLSFMAKALRDEVNDDSGLKVFVTDDVGTTAVFSKTLEFDWNHYWVDLETWRGEEITVTFQLDQQSDDPEMQLFLDDISLGSAYADIWVKVTGTNNASPDDQVVYEVSYGNQGGVAAEDVALTITLPLELNFEEASITPISTLPLTWDVGSLPASSGLNTFTITATVDSSVKPMLTVSPQFEIGMLADESEVGNNIFAMDLFIGERVYLPTIFR